MPPLPVPPPDVLVLGGGGVVGEAWMSGVLAGLEDSTGVDFRRCESYVGTSAGAIVSAGLVSGRSPRRPADGGEAASFPAARTEGLSQTARGAARLAGAYAAAVIAPAASVALAAGAPAGRLLRGALLSRIPRAGIPLDDLRARVERSGARFDGRLRVTAVDRDSGRRVAFGAPGAPHATVADAVVASCAVPWLFAPIRIGGREYVDGGMWSPTNLDLAPVSRATHVLCLTPTGARTSPFAAAGRSAAAVEALALRRRGARVRIVAPDRQAADAMGANLMDRARADASLRAGLAQGRRLGKTRRPY
jgi:NTE family protein